MNTHTKGPWAWQKFGNEWCLTGQYGMRPIILSARGKLQLRDPNLDLLIAFCPSHPDARLIAAAPALLEALQQVRTALIAWDKQPQIQQALEATNSFCSFTRAFNQIEDAIDAAKGGAR